MRRTIQYTTKNEEEKSLGEVREEYKSRVKEKKTGTEGEKKYREYGKGGGRARAGRFSLESATGFLGIHLDMAKLC